MFDSLRKKISDAISSIVKSEEKGEPIPEAALSSFMYPITEFMSLLSVAY